MNADEVRRAQMFDAISPAISQYYGFVTRFEVDLIVADVCDRVERAQSGYPNNWTTMCPRGEAA